jgi:hypothetical protein
MGMGGTAENAPEIKYYWNAFGDRKERGLRRTTLWRGTEP